MHVGLHVSFNGSWIRFILITNPAPSTPFTNYGLIHPIGVINYHIFTNFSSQHICLVDHGWEKEAWFDQAIRGAQNACCVYPELKDKRHIGDNRIAQYIDQYTLTWFCNRKMMNGKRVRRLPRLWYITPTPTLNKHIKTVNFNKVIYSLIWCNISYTTQNPIILTEYQNKTQRYNRFSCHLYFII